MRVAAVVKTAYAHNLCVYYCSINTICDVVVQAVLVAALDSSTETIIARYAFIVRTIRCTYSTGGPAVV